MEGTSFQLPPVEEFKKQMRNPLGFEDRFLAELDRRRGGINRNGDVVLRAASSQTDTASVGQTPRSRRGVQRLSRLTGFVERGAELRLVPAV